MIPIIQKARSALAEMFPRKTAPKPLTRAQLDCRKIGKRCLSLKHHGEECDRAEKCRASGVWP